MCYGILSKLLAIVHLLVSLYILGGFDCEWCYLTKYVYCEEKANKLSHSILFSFNSLAISAAVLNINYFGDFLYNDSRLW